MRGVFLLSLLALAGAGIAGKAATGSPGEATIALPPFLVEEAAKGPPWRYGRVGNYEILSRCDEGATRRVAEAHHRLDQLLAQILPPSLQLTWTVPRAVILYPEELQPSASQEVIARLLRDKPPLPEVRIDLPGGLSPRMGNPQRSIRFLPNLRLWDRDSMAVFMIVRRDGFDPERLALTEDYVASLVRQRVPTLPAWFVSGFLALYRESEYQGDRLRVPPLRWTGPVEPDAAKRDPASAPLPLADLLRRVPGAGSQPGDVALPRWQAAAALFVRWSLEPREPARAAAFFRFVERGAVEGSNEALFQSCFGGDFAAVDKQLAAYLPLAVRRELEFRPKRLERLPRFSLALASDGEIARIKGDWERLEVPYVRQISPDLEKKYLEQALKTLRRGRERAPTDSGLLAVLGLAELEAGDLTAATDHLERAAELGSLRPRANYELAKLRLARGRSAPEGAGGALSAAQLAHVLRPLFAAREAQPPLVETYELIAEAWTASVAQPTRRHLAVLDEGVRLFPRRAPLVLSAAELNLRFGFRAEAAALLEVATRVAAEDATRQRVAALAAALGVEAAPETLQR
jgi:tetratricopeptide (TPR) repeat protein